MLTDARELPDGIEVAADVVVIGAGPAGLTVAEELVAAGVNVCLLESGPETEDRSARVDAGGENAGQPYYRLEQSRGRGFGGTSQRWAHPRGVRLHPLDPVDFERRDAIPHSGWPFGIEALEPFYRRANKICGLDERGYEVDLWAERDRPALALPSDRVETTVFRFAPAARFGDHLPDIAARRGLQAVVNATAVEVLTDEAGGRVEGVRARVARGSLVARGQHVVLAAGGIDNARILLASRRVTPAGLGNGRDLVGRFFAEHPHARTGIVRLAPAALTTPLGLYHVHENGGARIQAKLRPAARTIRSDGLVNTAWFLFPRDPDVLTPAGSALVDLRESLVFRRLLPGTVRRLQVVATRPKDAAKALARSRGRREHRCIQLAFMAEQVPNPDSRVTVGRATDRHGLPVACLDWRLTELDREAVRRTQDILDEAFRAAGLGTLEGRFGDEDPPAVVGGGFHHMGTTRMHPDPTRGVVDPNCNVHGVAGLSIAGSSVFPTVGYANPTLTIIALACRLADHLRHRLGR